MLDVVGIRGNYPALPAILGDGGDDRPLAHSVVDFVALLAGHQLRLVAGPSADLARPTATTLPARSDARKLGQADARAVVVLAARRAKH